MKVLLGSCMWNGAKQVLESTGHDTKWVGEFTKDRGDEAILQIANQEKRVLITLDKDFGELAIVYEKPHHGIIRLVGHLALAKAQLV